MRIVVLDGYTLNPGDLNWEQLYKLGDVTIYERTAEQDIVARAQGAAIVLTNKTPLRAEHLAQLPMLQYIGVLATGYNVIDVAAARAQGVIVTNVPGYSTASVAQLVFALLLELCQRVGDHDAAVHQGKWSACPDFSFQLQPLMELQHKTLGIVGLGTIGLEVAWIAQAFGMQIIATNRSGKASSLAGVHIVSLEELLRRSDVVSLHCPLTPDTERMMHKGTLAQMKRSAYLINTSRGQLIAESELAEALQQGIIAGAALDVLSVEPPPADHPLLHAPRCILTPHLAWATREARERLMTTAVANVEAFQQGKPVHVVE